MGKAWAKLTFCQRSSACAIRVVPKILWFLNFILLVFVLLASALFWSIGVCVRVGAARGGGRVVGRPPPTRCPHPSLRVQSDAVDSVGVNRLGPILSSTFVVSIVFFSATCCCGGCMRVFVAPDAAFMDVMVYDPDATGTANSSRTSGWRARCARGVSFCSKLGP